MFLCRAEELAAAINVGLTDWFSDLARRVHNPFQLDLKVKKKVKQNRF